MDTQIGTTTAPGSGSAGLPRSVLLVGAAIVALIVVALAVAVAFPRTPTTYPAGSPQAAFQDFYGAWERGDLDTAYAHLSSAVRSGLTLERYRGLNSDQSWQRTQDRRLVLTGVDTTGDRATLHVRSDEFTGGGIGGQRYSSDREVRLVREAGSWLIDEPLVGIESVSYAY